MARSVVSADQIRQFRASFLSYGSNSESTLSSFRDRVASMLSDFEDKLDELYEDMEEKRDALNHCEWSHRHDDGDHCGSQRAAYHRAQARYSRCLALVEEARNAIAEFDSKAEGFRTAKTDLVSRAEAGLDRVEELIGDYSSGSATQGVASPGGQTPIIPDSGASGVAGTPEMHSAIHITRGDQIAYVLPKGSGTDPVVIDPEAMARKFDGLPPVQDPNPQSMRNAACSILAVLAAGGLVVGAKEMLLQQHADQIFEEQYGISRTELLIGSGPKQKEYVDAYNRIHQGLRQEMVEEQKRQISDKLNSVQAELNNLHNTHQVNMESIGRSDQLRVEMENLQNQLATLDDGRKRALKENLTYVAGLSEEQLAYLQDNGGMTPGRYATALITLAQSDYSFKYQNKDSYTFSDGSTSLEIAVNGSSISFEHASSGIGCSADAGIEANGSLSQSESLTWKSKEPSELKSEKDVGLGIDASASLGGSCSAAINYKKETFLVDPNGGVMSAGYGVQLGPEGHIGGGVKAGVSSSLLSPENNASDVQSGIGVGGEVGVSLSKGEVTASVSSRPVKVGRGIYQGGIEGSFGGELGASAEGSYQISAKGFEAKGEISALLRASAKGHVHTLSLDDLPESIANRLDSVPAPFDAALDIAGEVADAYARSMRPGERPTL